MGAKSLLCRMQDWRSLTDGLRQDLAEFPHLERDTAELEAMYQESLELFEHLRRLRAETGEATARLRSVARRGDMLRTRMGAAIRAVLTYESPQLLRYGLRPRRFRLVDPGPEPIVREEAVAADAAAPSPEPA